MPHHFTHYDVLGVKPDADEEDIRAAFRRLTRENHPDRFAGLEREQAEERFQTITEAFNVLSRPESRAKYDMDMALRRPQASASTAAMDRKEIARRLMGKGAEQLRAGAVADAVTPLKAAVDHDEESAKAQYLYGYALVRLKGRERDGLRHLEQAMQLEPNDASFKAEAALACLNVGLATRAARLAQEALALDPTNSKAARALAACAETDESKSGGLLDRLRRKG
jgi:curved DNA-binding protein CbpA